MHALALQYRTVYNIFVQFYEPFVLGAIDSQIRDFIGLRTPLLGSPGFHFYFVFIPLRLVKERLF